MALARPARRRSSALALGCLLVGLVSVPQRPAFTLLDADSSARATTATVADVAPESRVDLARPTLSAPTTTKERDDGTSFWVGRLQAQVNDTIRRWGRRSASRRTFTSIGHRQLAVASPSQGPPSAR